MAYIVRVKQVQARPIAAARTRLHPRDIPTQFRQSLDKVRKFLGYYPHLQGRGRNVFLYRHDMDEDGLMTIDFGVEVSQIFKAAGEVFCTTTPQGLAAATLHRGPYAGLRAGHEAVQAWLKATIGKMAAGAGKPLAIGTTIPKSWRRRYFICCVRWPPPSLSRKRSETPPPSARCARTGEAGLCLSPITINQMVTLRLFRASAQRHLPHQRAARARGDGAVLASNKKQ